MSDKKYIWKAKVRGHWLWCHARTNYEAINILSEQTGEPLEEYCLEWEDPRNLDGSKVTEAEWRHLWGVIDA